jgi:heme exporter protein B
MAVSDYLRAVYAVARKDILLELRTKRVVNTSVVFALLVVVTFAFSFVRSMERPATVGRAALWVAFLFAGTIGVMQSATVEERDAALEGLMLAPIDRSSIYLGKVVSNAVFVLAVELLTLGSVVVFLDYAPPVAAVPTLVAVVALASVGFAAAGVVLSVLASKSGFRELLLPVVLLPVVLPVLLAGIELTRAVTDGTPVGSWLQLLAVYDGILLLTGVVTFEYLVEE